MTLETIIPKELGLPAKYTQWRTDQGDCVDRVVGSGKKVFLLDAPTGAGKSLVGVASYKRLTIMDKVLDRMTDDEEEQKYRCLYLTKTIQLQEQILGDFPAAMIKGRKNYPCSQRAGDFPSFSAEDCPGSCSGFC